jgi:localization factor PodJL
MTAGVPWSVNAVEPETWAAARDAARRAGLSVGEWLEQSIRDLAAEERRLRRPQREQRYPERDRDDREDIEQRLDDIAEQLNHLIDHQPRRARAESRPEPRTERADPALAAAVASLNGRVEALMHDIDAADRRVPAQVEAAIQRLDTRLEALVADGRAQAPGVPPGIEHKLDELAQAIDQINRRIAREGASAASISDLDNAIAEITARQSVLDGGARAPQFPRRQLEAPTKPDAQLLDAFANIERRIDKLGERIESISRNGGSPAIAEIAGRLDDLRRTAARQPDLSGLERQLRSLQADLQRAPAAAADLSGIERQLKVLAQDMQRGSGVAPDLSGLERQLKVMADEMQQMRRSGMQSPALDDLRGQIGDLAQILAELAPRRSIEALEQAVEHLAQRVDRAARAEPRQDYAEVAGALAEIRAALSEVRPAESFRAVEADLRELSHKLDLLHDRGADAASVARIQAEIGDIRGMLASALPTDVLKALVDQIEVLVQKFESSPGTPAGPADTQVMNALSALDRRIDALGERIEAVGRSAAGPAITEIAGRLDELQRALAGMSRAAPAGFETMMRGLLDKLDAAEARLSNLDTIERSLNDLFAQFEETRASAIEIAERAARSAIREAAATLVPPRASQAAPEPVHPRPEPEPRVAPAREPPPEPARPVVRAEPPVVARETPRAEAARVEPTRVDPRPAEPTPPAVTSDLPPDFPLEPGSGAPRSRMASAGERVAQSEAALGYVAPKPAEGAPRAADFIAAARRAAQQAAAEKAAETPQSRAMGVVMDFGASIGRSRRSLLLGLLAILLVVVGTIRYGDVLLPGLFSSEQPEAVAPSPPPAAAPEPEPADPVPPTAPIPGRSALPADPALAAIPPAGILGPGPTIPLSLPQAEPREVTGSVLPPAPKPAAVAFLPKDLPAAIGPAALRTAALGGDPAAGYEIAARYFDGRGIEANATEALRWFELARAAGSPPAAFRLGNMYEKGQGIAKNLAEARRYYLLAAEGGHIKAMHNLAVLHAEGMDGKPDFKSAARWFRMAADRGLRDSQYNLGVLFARGLGVDANLAESYRWFALAAIQGDTDAAKKRDDVVKRLDAQTLVAAKLAVETWKPIPIDAAANNVQLKPEWQKAEPAPARKRSVKN